MAPGSHRVDTAMGISRKCVKTWLDRYAAEGENGLRERSSRPHSCPRQASRDVEDSIVEFRTRERRGPDWIGAELGVPARTVSRVIARRGLPRLEQLDPMTGEVIRASKATAVRYERQRPGELVHMDVKKLGKIPAGGGWAAHGRGPGDNRDRTKRIGYDFVHSLVDDHSRLAYSEILDDEQGPTCAAFLERAIAYFAGHGIAHIELLITDNAWAYKWSLREVCATHGIRQKFIKPHCPWQNGKPRTSRTQRMCPTGSLLGWSLRRWSSHMTKTCESPGTRRGSGVTSMSDSATLRPSLPSARLRTVRGSPSLALVRLSTSWFPGQRLESASGRL